MLLVRSDRDEVNADSLDAHIGAKLRSLRIEAGLTRKALASIASTTAEHLLAVEAGEARIDTVKLFCLTQFYGIRLSSFFQPAYRH
jgi:transcriptional regulator with XRE-family HTH domain